MAVVFTNSGHSAVVTRIIGSGAQPSYVGWGTSVGTMTTAMNAISGEINSRVQGTAAGYATTFANDTYQIQAVMSATAAYPITNAGVFDASTNGNSLILGDFGTLNLASGDSVAFTIRLQLT